MSDDENHVEPTPPRADDLANRLFAISMAGVIAFIILAFTFVILVD